MWGIEADTSSTLLAYVNPYFKYSDFVVNKTSTFGRPMPSASCMTGA